MFYRKNPNVVYYINNDYQDLRLGILFMVPPFIYLVWCGYLNSEAANENAVSISYLSFLLGFVLILNHFFKVIVTAVEYAGLKKTLGAAFVLFAGMFFVIHSTVSDRLFIRGKTEGAKNLDGTDAQVRSLRLKVVNHLGEMSAAVTDKEGEFRMLKPGSVLLLPLKKTAGLSYLEAANGTFRMSLSNYKEGESVDIDFRKVLPHGLYLSGKAGRCTWVGDKIITVGTVSAEDEKTLASVRNQNFLISEDQDILTKIEDNMMVTAGGSQCPSRTN